MITNLDNLVFPLEIFSKDAIFKAFKTTLNYKKTSLIQLKIRGLFYFSIVFRVEFHSIAVEFQLLLSKVIDDQQNSKYPQISFKLIKICFIFSSEHMTDPLELSSRQPNWERLLFYSLINLEGNFIKSNYSKEMSVTDSCKNLMKIYLPLRFTKIIFVVKIALKISVPQKLK